MLSSVVDLLGCPQCSHHDPGAPGEPNRTRPVRAGLIGGDSQLRCERGHTFDIARQGYVNLLRTRAGANADTAEMVAAREEFLATGHYRPMVEALATTLQQSRREPEGSLRPASTVLEAGAGTGYYLAGSLPESGRGLACDLSVAAVRKAARQPRLGAVVADTWAGLPVKDSVIDAVLCIFAPRNFAEFARVLRPGGALITLTPTTAHLAGLRDRFALLGIEPDKEERLHRDAAPWFVARSEQTLGWTFEATPEQVHLLVQMGPNAFHGNESVALTGSIKVDAEVRLSVFEPHPDPSAAPR